MVGAEREKYSGPVEEEDIEEEAGIPTLYDGPLEMGSKVASAVEDVTCEH